MCMTLRFWTAGEHSEALCHICKDWRDITFARRPFLLEQPTVVVNDVLVGVCNTCDTTISIPHQSSRKLRAANGEVFQRGSGNVFADLGLRGAALMLKKANVAHAILDRLEEGASMLSIPPEALDKLMNGRLRKMPLKQLQSYLVDCQAGRTKS